METIRSCIRSGRVCLLDCGPQALQYLYNAEFMPLVVLIAPPGINDFRQINNFRRRPFTEEQMEACIRENKELMESNYAKMFHIVLVNRNLDTTFRRSFLLICYANSTVVLCCSVRDFFGIL